MRKKMKFKAIPNDLATQLAKILFESNLCQELAKEPTVDGNIITLEFMSGETFKLLVNKSEAQARNVPTKVA